MAPAALAQESQADASGERSHGKRSPGNHRRPMHDSMNGYTNDQRERNGSGENDGAMKAPANSRGEGDEKIGEPDGDLGGADEQENERQIVSADMLELEQIHNRQDQKNGPGIGNLPLEVTAFCGVRLHAFGEPGLTYSV